MDTIYTRGRIRNPVRLPKPSERPNTGEGNRGSLGHVNLARHRRPHGRRRSCHLAVCYSARDCSKQCLYVRACSWSYYQNSRLHTAPGWGTLLSHAGQSGGLLQAHQPAAGAVESVHGAMCRPLLALPHCNDPHDAPPSRGNLLPWTYETGLICKSRYMLLY